MRLPWRRAPEISIDNLIKPPRQVFSGADESLQAKADARRKIAESIRKRSALVAAGSSAGSVLKIARQG